MFKVGYLYCIKYHKRTSAITENSTMYNNKTLLHIKCKIAFQLSSKKSSLIFQFKFYLEFLEQPDILLLMMFSTEMHFLVFSRIIRLYLFIVLVLNICGNLESLIIK